MQPRTLTIAGIILLVGSALAACATPTPPLIATLPPAPTAPAPTPSELPPATPTSVPIVTDDSWARVEAAGTLFVGTSADYPPFEFYNVDYQLDGFDIALMRAIGRKLGVQVEFNDYTFDGLPGALLNREFDAAIAAISVSPERLAFADFSIDYYVGDDALLARPEANLQITAPEQLAEYRVGVERGSVYDKWLVDTGFISPDNLFVYSKAGDAVRDLSEQRLDVVMLDFIPAQAFANQDRLAIVGRGLSRQHFAIMLRKGDAALLAKLNAALQQLMSDGTHVQLGLQYLDLELQPLPTATPAPPEPTPTPGPTATPAIPCDVMKYVADLNYDDKNMTTPAVLAPGQAFTKGWRIRNTGSCAWDNSYSFVYLDGNVARAQMGGAPVALQPVPVGGTADIYVNLLAPLEPGTYQGFWAMRNALGVTFGKRVWVGITVPGPPTPFPTQTPAPNIQFTSNRAQITVGEPVVFSWNVQGIKAIYFYQQGQPWEPNGVGGADSRTVYPQQSTNYELRVVQLNNEVQTRWLQIIVNPVPTAPEIVEFTANPDYQVQTGRCVQLHWNVRGQIESVRVAANGTALWDGAPVTGSQAHCPTGQSVTYSLEARGPGGTSRSERFLTIVQLQPKPQPTPVNLLADTRWLVVSLGRQIVSPLTRLDMAFDGGSRVSGTGACNSFSAQYSVGGSGLGITSLTQAANFCASPPVVMEQERKFFNALLEARSFEIIGSELILRDGRGSEVLRGLRQ